MAKISMNIIRNSYSALEYVITNKHKVNIKLRIYSILWCLWALFWTLIVTVGLSEGDYALAITIFILFVIFPFMPIYWSWNKNKVESSAIDHVQSKPIDRVKKELFSETKTAPSSILAPRTVIDHNPNILVSIISSKGFKVGIWEKLDINILNVGEGTAKNLEIKLSGPLETSGNKIIQVLEGNGDQTNIVIGLKPKEPGNIPLKVEVVFFDENNKPYKMKEEAFISVAKESETISIQQTPVINIGHIDRSTKIIDSMIQRSNIGASARKCPNCGREVEANEKFCMDCGARL